MQTITATQLRQITVAQIKQQRTIRVTADGEVVAVIVAVKNQGQVDKVKSIQL